MKSCLQLSLQQQFVIAATELFEIEIGSGQASAGKYMVLENGPLWLIQAPLFAAWQIFACAVEEYQSISYASVSAARDTCAELVKLQLKAEVAGEIFAKKPDRVYIAHYTTRQR